MKLSLKRNKEAASPRRRLFLLLTVAACFACQQSQSPANAETQVAQVKPSSPGGTASPGGSAGASQATGDPALVAKGRVAYRSACIACHNMNPKKAGPLGPDIAGSSLELITARVLTVSYPPGYKPKRATKAMKPLPQLREQIPALHAYLNSPEVLEK